MHAFSEFFKGSETTLGVFYPKEHLIAIFRNLEVAQQAAKKLQLAGFAEDQVVAAGGEEIIEMADKDTGVGAFLMRGLSRFIAAEQVYADHDLKQADRGAGFLAAHCPTEEIKQKAWKIVESEAPLDARYYGSGGIDHLAGDFDKPSTPVSGS